MLVVSTPAEKTAVTTVTAVKKQLKIAGDSEDEYIERAISQATDEFCGYLKVRRADDGTRTMGQETLVETFLAGRRHSNRSSERLTCRRTLVLARVPATSIASVVVGTTTLATTEYQALPSGLLERICDGRPTEWEDATVVVTYTAGWVMPEVGEGMTLPPAIEGAALDYIMAMRSARTRDPLVKREDIPGVLATDFWVGQVGNDSLPPQITSRLDQFRRPFLG